jgi:tryptophan-rich hypothetical protein
MKNKQKFPYLLGSKWTSQHKTWGWQHFQVINRRNQGEWVFAELVACCDSGVRFWVNAKQLKDRSLWQAGWRPLRPLTNITDDTTDDTDNSKMILSENYKNYKRRL